MDPQPTPGTLALLGQGAEGAVRNVARLTSGALGLALRPQRAVREVVGTAAALAEAVAPLVTGAPPSPLNRRPGPHRRVEVVRTSLAATSTVKRAFGATVNDVVLTTVAGALGRFLEGPRRSRDP